MSKILLSIKPEYVNAILAGTKKYEYRKTLPRKRVDLIYIYATSPEKKIVGYIEVLEVISLNKVVLWKNTNKEGGICHKKYFEYFKKNQIAHAYRLGKLTKFELPKNLSEFNISHAPQSFIYLDEK